ncbi:GNAT family N-acetyltransferase [Pseudomonas lundensis]|uniref:GNAT family N-acetyltransferase n=1 Tax=Serratia proteamaculans TaxID=28151 RepID=UPI00298229F9|nr:GNAT family N-acetyltransferase [Serratia proteamaculans]MDW5501977.1 GNAT family N-acetyltransferase [Serratia proteamaculans]MDW5507037.1 GNAT family N-acetyltransferase [Pseudomonas lundensis]
MINIVRLADYPQHRQQVIDWQWQAFGSESSRAFFASVVDSSLRGADLPITFIALLGDKPVGTVGLWRCDLISRQDLTPWLAALYVDESQRGSGLGLRLQQHVQDYSRDAGFSELYLYSDFSGYYERHGWRYLGDALDYPDRPVRLYHRELA